MSDYYCHFAIGDRVYADGCDDLTMIVTAVIWRNTFTLVECSWVSGDAKAAWIEPWRLTRIEREGAQTA
jgi:hypothetical protein